MAIKMRTGLVATAVFAMAGLGLSACGSSDTASKATSAASSAATSAADTMASTSAADTMASTSAATKAADTMAADADALFGPACTDYAKANPTGPGSVEGMSLLPVSQAASANPLLKTLVKAVAGQLNKDVNLVDTLDGGEFTVFAPADSAFAKLDAATVATLGTPEGKDTLAKILTYHVVPTQIAPSKIDGAHKTVQGGEVTVSGTGQERIVTDANGGAAKILCGGIKTKNATVYLIDTVLMPK